MHALVKQHARTHGCKQASGKDAALPKHSENAEVLPENAAVKRGGYTESNKQERRKKKKRGWKDGRRERVNPNVIRTQPLLLLFCVNRNNRPFEFDPASRATLMPKSCGVKL